MNDSGPVHGPQEAGGEPSGRDRVTDVPDRPASQYTGATQTPDEDTVKTRRLIKKYANRRLYDTIDSKHVTLRDIRTMIVSGNDVKIIDDTTGDDITRPLLLQIIVEQEQAGQPILSELLLAQLIRFYGNPMQGMMADYLQQSVDTFVGQQATIQQQMQNMLTKTPISTMQDIMRQNMVTWEKMFGHAAEAQGENDKPDAHSDSRADSSRDSRSD